MKLKYKILNKINLYSGFFKFYKYEFIHQKHNGEWSKSIEREIFAGSNVGALLPYDPIKKEIILIQQFRVGSLAVFNKDYLYEIVAGMIDKNENPEEAARRECLEETGCSVKNIKHIISYLPDPGSTESYSHVFLGEVDSFTGQRIMGLESESENILVKSFKVEHVREMLRNNQIKNGLTIIALQWFFLEYYKP